MSLIGLDDKNLIFEVIYGIDEYKILNDVEVNIIITNMDKTDYTNLGNYPRWIDLERICKDVIDMKKNYKTWILEKIHKFRQTNTSPPYTYYKYEFKNDNNMHFFMTNVNI